MYLRDFVKTSHERLPYLDADISVDLKVNQFKSLPVVDFLVNKQNAGQVISPHFFYFLSVIVRHERVSNVALELFVL